MFKWLRLSRVKKESNANFLSIGKAAKRLGVSSKTLRRWEASGKFVPASRHPINNYRLYRVEQIEELLIKMGENHD